MNHTIVHFEIPAEDLERLKTFYRDVFGWTFVEAQGDYWMIQTVPTDEDGMPLEPRVNGGMVERQGPDHTITNYISVESIDKFTRKLEDAGGKILVEKTPVPGVGYWAIFQDPDGNSMAIMEEDEEAE